MASTVPVAALQQFLAALKAKQFEGAKVLAFQSELRRIRERLCVHLLKDCGIPSQS